MNGVIKYGQKAFEETETHSAGQIAGHSARNKNAGRRRARLWNMISFFSIAVCAGIFIHCYQKGIFTSVEAARSFVSRFGCLACLAFVWLQVMQVVVPVLPGGIGCIGGVILFGAWKGFLYNYIGVCAGSFLAFGIAKHRGRAILLKLIPEKALEKYERWTEKGHRFVKIFTAAIILPFAPDDILCYLAGTTTMSWKQFGTIILLGKPLAVAMYSLGLTAVFQRLLMPG